MPADYRQARRRHLTITHPSNLGRQVVRISDNSGYGLTVAAVFRARASFFICSNRLVVRQAFGQRLLGGEQRLIAQVAARRKVVVQVRSFD